MKNIKFVQFHESTIVDFHLSDLQLQLKIDEAIYNGVKSEINIEFDGVRELFVDDVVCRKYQMPFPDGEIYTLEISETSAKLIVQWNDFKKHYSVVHSYYFVFNGMRMT
jgi:hypothetical protein